jgi:hypothetical protein
MRSRSFRSPQNTQAQIVVPQPAKPFHLVVGNVAFGGDQLQAGPQGFVERAAFQLVFLVHNAGASGSSAFSVFIA